MLGQRIVGFKEGTLLSVFFVFIFLRLSFLCSVFFLGVRVFFFHSLALLRSKYSLKSRAE